MSTATLLPLCLACLAISWFLTWVVRRYALTGKLIDQPNARSSHTVPTPRGGGLAIVLSFAAALGAASMLNPEAARPVAAIAAAGLLVAAVGFVDDWRHVLARWRLLGHFSAAGLALWALDGAPPILFLGFQLQLGWTGVIVATLYLVWMTNLFNFMDGIDGIAAIEAVTVSWGGGLVWWLASGTPYWFIPVLLGVCALGFLIWNYPPAKIFMGDTGSCFIGMVLGTMSLWAAHDRPAVFWGWFILLGCFMVDATATLVRRVLRGEKAHEAHRSHAYQFASRKHRSHKRVSLTVAAINVLWLLPLAALVTTGRLEGVIGATIGYVPLIGLAVLYKAGAGPKQEV